MPNVREIIVGWLKIRSYDGLCTEECGCGLGNLAPCCGESFMDCVPAYKTSIPPEYADVCSVWYSPEKPKDRPHAGEEAPDGPGPRT